MLRKQKMTKRAASKAKGQSTVEYIILVAAIIAAVLVFLPGGFRTAFENALTSGTNGMENMAGRLQASRPLAP